MKKILAIVLIMLYLTTALSAENASKSLYDVAQDRLEKKFKLKYKREYDPQIYFYARPDSDGYTFSANEDYEIYIDTMAQVLEDHQALSSEVDTPFYQQPFAYFAYGIICSALIASAVK